MMRACIEYVGITTLQIQCTNPGLSLPLPVRGEEEKKMELEIDNGKRKMPGPFGRKFSRVDESSTRKAMAAVPGW